MKIKFKVKNNFYILTGDSKNYILEELSEKEKPLQRKYYKNLNEMLKDIYDMSLRRSENVDSFRALAKEGAELNRIIRKIADELTYK